MRTVTGTIVWYAEVSVEVNDAASNDDVRSALIEEANRVHNELPRRNPVVHACSIEELVD